MLKGEPGRGEPQGRLAEATHLQGAIAFHRSTSYRIGSRQDTGVTVWPTLDIIEANEPRSEKISGDFVTETTRVEDTREPGEGAWSGVKRQSAMSSPRVPFPTCHTLAACTRWTRGLHGNSMPK